MATVRIYKVAELLNTSSQEVLALLKRAHGIELKSASSTIEEVVARQFVDRMAKRVLGEFGPREFAAGGTLQDKCRWIVALGRPDVEPEKFAHAVLPSPWGVESYRTVASTATFGR